MDESSKSLRYPTPCGLSPSQGPAEVGRGLWVICLGYGGTCFGYMCLETLKKEVAGPDPHSEGEVTTLSALFTPLHPALLCMCVVL